MRRLLIIFVLALSSLPALAAGAAAAGPLNGMVIAVDPGHGGYDPGTVRGEIYEKNINLQIARRLKESLEAKGAAVVLTRDGDYNLAVPDLHRNEAHRYDLAKRLEIAERSGAGFFISIHINSIRYRSCRGAEVFFSPRSEKGKVLAGYIQEELLTMPDMSRRTAKPSSLFILENAGMPAVLIEAGYLSNPEEKDKLLNSDYQKLLSEKIACGIEKYAAQN